MTNAEVQRKLAAILCADVEGYSRLVRDDPEATIHTLKDYRAVFTRCCECLNGRVIDSPGDNLLIEFPSTVDAVQCAVEIQRELAEKNAELAEDRRMHFRIGIDLGDILEKDGALFGDGVNISSRLQALAEIDGICISGKVYEQVVNRLPLQFEFVGKRTIKNFDEPMRVYRVLTKPGDAAHRVIKARREVSRRWRTVAVAALAVIVLVAFGAVGWRYFGWPHRDQTPQSAAPSALPAAVQPASVETPTPPKAEKPSIAVLPFVNMSDDREQEFLSDGITEELIGALAKLEGVKVISRTSAFNFKGKDVDLRTIGARLGVENVLEGSVRRAGNTLRVSAQLIKVADDTHLWAETYEREFRDVFDIQDEITRAVVKILKVKLMGDRSVPLVTASTGPTEAYDLLLKGRFFEYQGTPEGRKKALECWEKAIEIDPRFAPAYVQIARWHKNATMYTGGGIAVNREENLAKIYHFLNKALELDPNSADAHAAMGSTINTYEMNWKEAERYIKKALELNPGSATAHTAYAYYVVQMGRVDETLAEAKIAMDLDPMNPAFITNMGTYLWFARKYDQAITHFSHAQEMFPKYAVNYLHQARVYATIGNYEESLATFQKALSLQPNNPLIWGNLGFVYARAGRIDEARKILDTLDELAKKMEVPLINHAKIYAALGDMDKAFECLEKAWETREESGIRNIRVMPDFDLMRSDPRFDALLKKMGLAD